MSDDKEFQLHAETDDYVDLIVGRCEWIDTQGRYRLEKDFRVDGEVWRVHKNDADPFPSKPHAHCMAGKKRYIGCTVHLGTAERYFGREASGEYLDKKQFDRLINLIKPKFPGLVLPLVGQ